MAQTDVLGRIYFKSNWKNLTAELTRLKSAAASAYSPQARIKIMNLPIELANSSKSRTPCNLLELGLSFWKGHGLKIRLRIKIFVLGHLLEAIKYTAITSKSVWCSCQSTLLFINLRVCLVQRYNPLGIKRHLSLELLTYLHDEGFYNSSIDFRAFKKYSAISYLWSDLQHLLVGLRAIHPSLLNEFWYFHFLSK